MNEPPSTKKLFFAKPGHAWLVWGAVLFGWLPFFVGSFYGGMAGDDYGYHYYFGKYGFWGTQRFVYTQWTGLYTSTFLGSFLMRLGWPEHYYFLHTLLLFIFLAAVLYFLLSSINRSCLGNVVGRPVLALSTAILLLLSLYVQAEVSTGFYWFSSAMTYETAYILFLLLAAFLVRRFPKESQHPLTRGRIRAYDGMILLLIIVINGTNEVAALFLTGFLGVGVLAAYYYFRPHARLLLLYLGLSLATGIVIVLTSGILSGRATSISSHSHTSAAAIVPMIIFRVGAVFYYVLKVPLFWIGGGILFVAGGKLGQERAAPGVAAMGLVAGRGRSLVLPGLLAVLALVIFPLAAILIASKGSLPDRALNNLTELTAFCLWFLSFVAGVQQGITAVTGPVVALRSAAVAGLVMVGLFASDNGIDAWKGVFSGYFYHSVDADRRQQLQKAAQEHQKTVILEPFDKARREKVREAFPHGVFVTAQEMLDERPIFLFRGIDLDTPDPGWPMYYNLESVIIK